ncbi:MAG: branched-chain amino acid ABC transporter permease [Hyphomicrobiales bacterium]|nr:branched-chain amino acid ABC transporter permease [Hyphomicrobiales bacterium]
MSDTNFFRRHAIWFAIAAVFLVLPLVFQSEATLKVLAQISITVIFALSYNMLLGQGGMLSFGHAVYFGMAGYMSCAMLDAIDQNGIYFPVMFMPVIGALTGLFWGVIFGFVSTKRAGVTFALITLGIGELMATAALTFNNYFGGEMGRSTDRMVGPELLGLTYGPQIQVYFVVAAWTFLCMIAIYAYTHTPLGRMAQAVRDNPERVAFVGYDPVRVRFYVFSLAGLFAGIAGSLFAINLEIVTAEAIGESESASVLIAAYIGGLGHFFGPVIGAVVTGWLSMELADFTDAWLLYLGLFFMIVVLYMPQGLAGLIAMHQPVWRARMMGRLWSPYWRVGIPGAALFVGVVIIVEMAFHLSIKANAEGTEMSIMGVPFDSAGIVPWAIAVTLVGAGGYFMRRGFPAVSETWQEIGDALRGGGGG